MICSVNLYGLANDISIFGSAYSGFQAADCNASYAAYPIPDTASDYEPWRQLGFNMFRLPLGWQHAQESLSGPLNETTMASLDLLIEAITSNGSVAILDIVSRNCQSLTNQADLGRSTIMHDGTARSLVSLTGHSPHLATTLSPTTILPTSGADSHSDTPTTPLSYIS